MLFKLKVLTTLFVFIFGHADFMVAMLEEAILVALSSTQDEQPVKADFCLHCDGGSTMSCHAADTANAEEPDTESIPKKYDLALPPANTVTICSMSCGASSPYPAADLVPPLYYQSYVDNSFHMPQQFSTQNNWLPAFCTFALKIFIHDIDHPPEFSA